MIALNDKYFAKDKIWNQMPRKPIASHAGMRLILSVCVCVLSPNVVNAGLNVYDSGHRLEVTNSFSSFSEEVPPEQLTNPLDSSLQASLEGVSADTNMQVIYDDSQLNMELDLRQQAARFDSPLDNDFSDAISTHYFFIRPTQDVLVTVEGLISFAAPTEDHLVRAKFTIYSRDVPEQLFSVSSGGTNENGEKTFSREFILPAGGDYQLSYRLGTEVFATAPLDVPATVDALFSLNVAVIPEPTTLALTVLCVVVVCGRRGRFPRVKTGR